MPGARCFVRLLGAAAILLLGGVPVVADKEGPKGPAIKPGLAFKDGKAQVEDKLTGDLPRDKGKPGNVCKVYPVRMEAGRTYIIDQVSKEFDSYLRLEDSTGKELHRDDDGGGALNARIVFACKTGGNYNIIATALSGMGRYTLSVREYVMPKPILVTLKDGKARVQGKLTKADSKDRFGQGSECKVYTIRLEARRGYQIDLASKDFDAFLRIEDPTGKEVARDDDSGGGTNARVKLLSQKTGLYHVIATTGRTINANKESAFSLMIEEKEALKPAEVVIKGRMGRIDATLAVEDPRDLAGPGGQCKIFTVKLEAGRAYCFDHMSGDYDAYLRIEDPAGKEVARDDDSGGGRNARIRYMCRQTGSYTMIASSLGGIAKKCSFTLAVEKLAVAKPIPIALKDGKIQVDGTLAKEDPGDYGGRGGPCRTYTVRLEAGQIYRIDMMSKSFDSYLRIEDSTGKKLGEDDDGGGANNARLRFLCRQTATYHVITTTPQANTFERKGKTDPNQAFMFALHIEPEKATAPIVLAFKDGKIKVEGKLAPDGFHDRTRPGGPSRVYILQLQAGKSYRLDLMGQRFDPYVRLESVNGQIVAEDDDGGEGLNARTVFRCTEAGTYYLFATTYANPLKLGSYTLTVQQE